MFVDFSAQAQFSSVMGVNSENQVVTPKSGKIDIEIRNFPYKGPQYIAGNDTTGSYVAIETFVAAASADGSFQLSLREDNTISGGEGDSQLYFTWQKQADCGKRGQCDVRVSGMSAGTKADLPGNSGQIYFSGNASAQMSVSKIYYSFTGPRSDYIYWDPAVGVGEQPKNPVIIPSNNTPFGLSAGAIAAIAVSSVVAVAAVVILFLRMRKQASEEHIPLTTDTPSNTYQ
jgi:hypothetical protein